MAGDNGDHDLLVLEHVARTLANLPVARLPHAVGQITSNLLQCKITFLSDVASAGKGNSRGSPVLHRIKTRIAALLQDRSAAGRWSGVVLAKAYTELGGYHALQTVGPWVPKIITILKRPHDPVSTKKMCCLLLTRIFTLTRSYQTLQREITTPHLPDYLNACLSHFSYSDQRLFAQKTASNVSILEVMLQSFNNLLPHHPTIFRNFADKLRRLSVSVLTGSEDEEISSDRDLPVDTLCETLACELYVKLHHTAQKNGASESWGKGLASLCMAARITSSQALRAFSEISRTTDGTISVSEEPSEADQSELGFPGWTGVDLGVQRLIVHLRLMKSFLATSTTFPVGVKFGPLLDLLCKLLSVLPTPIYRQRQEIFNPSIARSEREAAIAFLPRVQIAALEIMSDLLKRLEKSSILIIDHVLDQVAYTFAGTGNGIEIRMSIYRVVRHCLRTVGSCMDRKATADIEPILMACCKDLLDAVQSLSHKETTSGNAQIVNPDALLTPSAKAKAPRTTFGALEQAAESLLTTALLTIPPQALTTPCRTKLEQAAILTSNSDAINAAVINPAQRGQGILPIAARIQPANLITEVLSRPRMPIISSGILAGRATVGDGDEMSTNTALNEVNGSYGAYTSNNAQTEVYHAKSESAEDICHAPTFTVASDSIGTANIIPSKSTLNVENSDTAADGIHATSETVEPEPKPVQSSKRAALEEKPVLPEPAVKRMRTEPLVAEAIKPMPVNTAPMYKVMDPAEDDDDIDDDDIPPLVFKTDSEDEDEDDEAV